ncbi:MAG: hypothetical protein Q8K91_05645, partial [Hylemonella sp.]|nr:hypothetical protein [bacterium]MDP1936671.1 hypothetical protein [Hylemonella sp.]
TDEVFRFLVVSQQAVDQFVRDGHLVAIPWECSSFLPIDRLHKSFYTPRETRTKVSKQLAVDRTFRVWTCERLIP